MLAFELKDLGGGEDLGAETGATTGPFPNWEADMKDFLICDLLII